MTERTKGRKKDKVAGKQVLGEKEIYRICVFDDDSFSVVSPSGPLKEIASVRIIGVTFTAMEGTKPKLVLHPARVRGKASEAERAVRVAHLTAQSSKRPSRTGVLDDDLYPLDAIHKALLVNQSDLRNSKPCKLIPLSDVEKKAGVLKVSVPVREDCTEVLDIPAEDVEVVDLPVVARAPGDAWILNRPEHVKQAILELAGAENILSSLEAILMVSQVDQPAFSIVKRQTGQFTLSETLRIWFLKAQLSREDIESKVQGNGQGE